MSIMLYVSNIDEYLKILTNYEVKNFVPINFSEYLKSTTKLNLGKVGKFYLYFSNNT